MDAALKFLTARMRTVRETEEYLDNMQFGEAVVDMTVARLKELGLLDDQKFAAEFVRSRLASKPVSRSRLYGQMKLHKLPEDVIEEALSAVPEETETDNARAVAKKYLRQMADYPPDKRRERVLQRLMARGFSTENALKVFTEALEEENGETDPDA